MGDSESTPEVDLEALEARVGKTIKGKWTIEKLLGVGGMAAVYAAKHEIGRREALKILHETVARDADVIARFKREAKVANRFSHPGAVEIRDVDVSEEGEPFLIMELLEGRSLSRRLKREGPLAPDEALRIADEVLDVLAAAHASGVIHRDIKPSNLFLVPDGRIKVLDFGVARLAHGKTTMITEAGTTLGTVAYMPPEQLRSSVVDHRADLYALGATLFKALTGKHAHEAADEVSLARHILEKPARSLGAFIDDQPDLVKVIDRALAILPDRRYPDARTMQSDVRAIRAGKPPPFASARVAEGDDPASREPLDEVELPASSRPPAIDEDADTDVMPTAPIASSTPAEVEEATDRMDAEEPAETADEGTIKMVADKPSPTRIDAPEPEQAASPAGPASPPEEPSSRVWVYLAAAAVIAVVVYLGWGRSDPSPETTYAPPTATDLPSGQGGVRPLLPEPGAGGTAGEVPEAEPPEPGGRPPIALPTGLPTSLPSGFPTSLPTGLPSGFPTSLPTTMPTLFPTAVPTSWPTAIPTAWPTSVPKAQPPPPPAPPPPPPPPAEAP